MTTAKISLAGAAALCAISSASLAQERTGTVTKVNRVDNTIAIQQAKDGTVGANTSGAAEEFKAQDNAMLNTVHAGDKVVFTASESNGVKTITKVQRQ
jgi:Cu/Ag efflux protein CusF